MCIRDSSKVGDVEEMIFNSLKILTSSKLKEELSANAFARAKEFDIHNIVPQYEALYKRVIEKTKI